MARIRVSLKGFDKLIEQVKNANGNVDEAVLKAVRDGAKAAEDALRDECSASGVPGSITSEITTEVNQLGNRTSAKVGWKMGAYDPKNPAAGYKAVFFNYGTARRTTKKEHTKHVIDGKFVTLGKDRGAIEARGFIERAKKKARPEIKKAQEEALKKILEELT